MPKLIHMVSSNMKIHQVSFHDLMGNLQVIKQVVFKLCLYTYESPYSTL